MKQLAQDLLSHTLFRHNCLLPLTAGNRFVFVFHDISTESEPHHHQNYSVTPSVFFEQIRALKSLFRLVSLDALCETNNPSSPNEAAIVFDDGFRSVSTVAAPYLQANGIPFAVFVNGQALREDRLWCSDVVLGRSDQGYLRSVYDRYFDSDGELPYEQFARAPLAYLVPSSRLEDDYRPLEYRGAPQGLRTYMNPKELLDLKHRGAVVGSHSVSHRVIARLSHAAAKIEVEENRRYLESLLQAEVRHFAFPFGFPGTFDRRTARLALAEHRFVYTTNRVFFRQADLAIEGVMLPRICLQNEGRAEILSAVNLSFFVDRRRQLVA